MTWPRNFSLAEFACKCGCQMSEKVELNCRAVAWSLQRMLRDPLQTRVKIISGYRCPDHNRAVKGKPLSRHLTGEAADIKVWGDGEWLPGEWVRGWIEAYLRLDGDDGCGIGTYVDKPHTVHYDIRGARAR